MSLSFKNAPSVTLLQEIPLQGDSLSTSRAVI